MKWPYRTAVTITFCSLAACASPSGTTDATPALGSGGAGTNATADLRSLSSLELVNLDYSNGSITVYSVQNGRAEETTSFTPGGGLAQGLAVDKAGRIYTAITSSSSKPCAACVEIFTRAGRRLARLPAPILASAPGAPSLTDVSVDAHDDVYVSDYGQQAVYFFRHANGKAPPTVIVQNSHNAASVLSVPSGKNVLISGGCGFASVAPFTRESRGHYVQGACFGIGTIALIGGAADNQTEVLTPVDGVTGLVSVSSPSGGAVFHTPDQLHASISGVALNGDASIAYVANAAKGYVYAFARPAGGWLSGSQPKVLARYKGFKNLDIIAVRP
jgi:hypothetical protein